MFYKCFNKSGWPSGLRRQTQGLSFPLLEESILVLEWGRGFKSHFWQNLFRHFSFFFYSTLVLGYIWLINEYLLNNIRENIYQKHCWNRWRCYCRCCYCCYHCCCCCYCRPKWREAQKLTIICNRLKRYSSRRKLHGNVKKLDNVSEDFFLSLEKRPSF